MMIIRNRARKPIAHGPVTAQGIAPHGIRMVGTGNEPCFVIHVGDVRVIITASEWDSLVSQLGRLTR
jgi:hypothetical protein